MADYVTPAEHRLALHFSKSRFNRSYEDILLMIANEMAKMGVVTKDEFKQRMTAVLAPYLGSITQKAFDNNVTEPTRLFGMVIYQDKNVSAGNRTLNLARNQDVPGFFKAVCNKFQFPSGVNAAHVTKYLLSESVRFKPAQYLIKLLRAGSVRTGKTFAVTAKEIAHLVFNDKRVTVGQEPPEQRLNLFLELRNKNILCNGTNDVIRYARDFLNFMVWANLMIEYKKKYFLNEQEKTALDFIQNDDTFFEDFELAKQGTIVETAEITEARQTWTEYYADSDFDEESILKTSLSAFSQAIVEITSENNKVETIKTGGLDFTGDILEIAEAQKAKGQTTKDIGDEGEVIVYRMERDLVKASRPDLLGLVKIVSNDTSLGFDIQSVLNLETGSKKYIEVKTTKRNFTPGDFSATSYFNISYNEWITARQYGDSYFIARVIIAREKLSIFIIQNPYKQFQEKKIRMYPTEYRLIYQEDAGEFIVKDQVNV